MRGIAYLVLPQEYVEYVKLTKMLRALHKVCAINFISYKAWMHLYAALFIESNCTTGHTIQLKEPPMVSGKASY